jgi:hypothetical protein
LFLRLHSRGNRKDTRRLRFSFFLLQCQSAGDLHPVELCYCNPLEVDLRDRQDLSRFPLARLPAGFADRVLISHRGVGAFAPASLSDAVYRFHSTELSNKNRTIFELFYKLLFLNNKICFPQPRIQRQQSVAADFHDNQMKILGYIPPRRLQSTESSAGNRVNAEIHRTEVDLSTKPHHLRTVITAVVALLSG